VYAQLRLPSPMYIVASPTLLTEQQRNLCSYSVCLHINVHVVVGGWRKVSGALSVCNIHPHHAIRPESIRPIVPFPIDATPVFSHPRSWVPSGVMMALFKKKSESESMNPASESDKLNELDK
jgi:hypothetical protein